jgi:HNH endonuclease
MSRWVRIDRRYNQPFRLTGYAWRAILKWTGLLLLWALINSELAVAHLGLLILGTTGGLIWYAVHCVRRNRAPELAQPVREPVTPPAPANYRFNPPPDWPAPPADWSPPPGWQPDPSWPPAPPGWQFWLPVRGAAGERNTRTIPQDVKIAVSVRDQGRCVQCGSAEELHYDHKIPWSKGGANTVNNIQLLCGTCNRRKGADDIPAY